MPSSPTANGLVTPTDWQSVAWRKANRIVRNLRRRIFKAAQAGDLKKVRSLRDRSWLLEPCAVQIASTVLRGRGGGDATPLPGEIAAPAELADLFACRGATSHPDPSGLGIVSEYCVNSQGG